jgi:hypothetical protein
MFPPDIRTPGQSALAIALVLAVALVMLALHGPPRDPPGAMA